VGQVTKQELLEALREENPEALLADGFEAAFCGICRRFGMEPVAAYDLDHCLLILRTRDGMSEEEAVEFFEFNVIGAWMGDGTPVFLTMPSVTRSTASNAN
jgi:hypothetical protein